MAGAVQVCEERIASTGGRRGSVLASRATTGLAAALGALRLEQGSGVLMPVMVCANVVYAVRGAGLRPVFVDVEPQKGGIGVSLEAARRCAEKDGGCRALLAIPLFGGEVDREGLLGLASEAELMVVEDAAQVGLVRGGGHSKGIGVCSVVSFGAGKVGAAGAGGAVLSDDLDLLARVRSLLGNTPTFEQKMAEIAPAVMGALDGLKDEVEGRLRRASDYRSRLRQDGVTHVGEVLPVWKYSVLLRDRVQRDHVTRQLLEKGIAATNLCPPLVRWFAGVDGETYDGAKALHERIVNLPLWDEGSTHSTGSAEGVFEQILDINKMKEEKR